MFLNFDENDIAYMVYGPGPSSAVLYTFGKWNIPQKASFITFICIGGGGGGGSGRSAASGIARGGGGGGASGSWLSATYHTSFLPESIAYAVGKGGAGGASGTNGTNGSETIVFLPVTNFTSTAGNTLARASGGDGGVGTQTTGDRKSVVWERV